MISDIIKGETLTVLRRIEELEEQVAQLKDVNHQILNQLNQNLLGENTPNHVISANVSSISDETAESSSGETVINIDNKQKKRHFKKKNSKRPRTKELNEKSKEKIPNFVKGTEEPTNTDSSEFMAPERNI